MKNKVKMSSQKTINKFKFKCSSCSKKYEDESFDKTMESECPWCGEWNYTTKRETIRKQGGSEDE